MSDISRSEAPIRLGGLTPAAVCDGGDLDCGSGLLMIIRRAMNQLDDGQILEIRSRERSVKEDLPAWCRMTANDLLAWVDGGDHTRYLVKKGNSISTWGKTDWGIRIAPRPLRGVDLRDWFVGRAGELPAEAPTTAGFAPRGAVVEPGAPAYPFTINTRAEGWADNLADLYEQAKAGQWDATTDIPWDTLQPLPEEIERAVCQLMTFLAENEYSALYIPAKFLPRINPRFAEVVLFLATVMNDEARHIEAFTKRALANGGGLQYASASTELSLKTLLAQEDYTNSSFLLHVLGEGTFLDLLKFIEAFAPDPVTREVVRRARADEGRHVAYGIAHVRHALAHDARLKKELIEAVSDRASVLDATSGVNPFVQESLAVLAGGGSEPLQMARGVEHGRKLYEEMHVNRTRRLVAVGFDQDLADQISALHTPNFM